MKKILLCAAMLFLVSCSQAPSPTEILDDCRMKLAGGCTFDLQFSTGQEATLRWSAEKQELAFTAPDAIGGLCYVRDDAGLTVTFEGISARISEESLPPSAAVGELYEAFDAFCGATPLSVSPHPSADADTFPPRGRLELQSDLLLFEQEGHSVWIDTESCLPIAVETEHWAVALALHNAL